MAQLDLDSPVCGGGEATDERRAAELSGSGSCSDGATGDERDGVGDGDGIDPYAPPESLRLRIGEDIDWIDVVGAVLERDDSTKGASNPKSAARRRTSCAGAPKAVAVVIGGLPAGKAAREQGRRRQSCRLGRARARARVFAGESVDDAAVEPGSPKVSCLGGVRSQQLDPAAASSSSGRRGWWWPCLASVVCCGRFNPSV